MSILDIIDKDKLKEILTEENFEIIQKIYNEKTNEQKLQEVKEEIERNFPNEYIIKEMNITRNGNKFDDIDKDEWYYDNFNTNEYVKYKYSVKTKSGKDSFELTIIEYNDPDGAKYTSFIHMKRIMYVRYSETPYFKIFTKTNNCDFFLNNVLFNPYIRYDAELVDMGFYKTSLFFLDPIKLIHEKYQGVENFYYCANEN
jgi:hypothetical protein